MKDEFKAGDLIFLIDRVNYIRLAKYTANFGSKSVEAIDIETGDDCRGYGFAVTPENRQALVTLYGEDEVPELPLRGSDLTKKLLNKQKYVLCFCSDTNDDDCRENKKLSIISCFKDGFFYDREVDSHFAGWWKCAVPIDNNGNEITEIE